MGTAKASELLLFNKKISTTEACKLGLVTEVYPASTFQSDVWPKLKEMSELPPLVTILFLLVGRIFFILL